MNYDDWKADIHNKSSSAPDGPEYECDECGEIVDQVWTVENGQRLCAECEEAYDEERDR